MNRVWSGARTIGRRRFLAQGSVALVGASTVFRAFGHAGLDTSPSVEVETSYGRVRGAQGDGVVTFKGIPYAGSVSGRNRFKAAPPLRAWTGVRDALQFGAPAIQPNRNRPNEPPPAEDCLFLNVWTPAADGRKRPVMFYSHGGGFTIGSAGAAYQDGSSLARAWDVVVVATNHRLGLMGYLYLGHLGGEEYAESGSHGLLDLRDGLKWVFDNIERFGGDPKKVMIFGESGGGAKTSCLYAMPSAAPYFNKASIESGPGIRVYPVDSAIATTGMLLKQLGLEESQWRRLLDVPAERLLDVQVALGQNRPGPLMPNGGRSGISGNAVPGGFGPVLDGRILPDHPFDPAAPAVSRDKPLIVGYNRDEMNFFFAQNRETDVYALTDATLKARLDRELGPSATAVLAAYRKSRPDASPADLYVAIASARFAGIGSTTIAERKYAQRGAPVYMLRLHARVRSPDSWHPPHVRGRARGGDSLQVRQHPVRRRRAIGTAAARRGDVRRLAAGQRADRPQHERILELVRPHRPSCGARAARLACLYHRAASHHAHRSGLPRGERSLQPRTAGLGNGLGVSTQRSTASSIQTSLRDSLIGSSRCVVVTAMSIWTVRVVSANRADLNDVTGNGLPTGTPLEGSNPAPPHVRNARAVRDEVEGPSIGAPRRLVVKPCAFGDLDPAPAGRRNGVDGRRRGVPEIVGQKADPALVWRETLVVEIAVGIGGDHAYRRRVSGLGPVRHGNEARRCSVGPAKAAGAKDRTSVSGPVGCLHVEVGRVRHDSLARAVPVEHRDGETIGTNPMPREGELRPVRRPPRLHQPHVQTRQEEARLSCDHRPLPQLVAAGPHRAIDQRGAVRADVEVHLAGATVGNRVRLAGNAATPKVERKRPQPRPARDRRQEQPLAVRRDGDVGRVPGPVVRGSGPATHFPVCGSIVTRQTFRASPVAASK